MVTENPKTREIIVSDALRRRVREAETLLAEVKSSDPAANKADLIQKFNTLKTNTSTFLALQEVFVDSIPALKSDKDKLNKLLAEIGQELGFSETSATEQDLVADKLRQRIEKLTVEVAEKAAVFDLYIATGQDGFAVALRSGLETKINTLLTDVSKHAEPTILRGSITPLVSASTQLLRAFRQEFQLPVAPSPVANPPETQPPPDLKVELTVVNTTLSEYETASAVPGFDFTASYKGESQTEFLEDLEAKVTFVEQRLSGPTVLPSDATQLSRDIKRLRTRIKDCQEKIANAVIEAWKASLDATDIDFKNLTTALTATQTFITATGVGAPASNPQVLIDDLVSKLGAVEVKIQATDHRGIPNFTGAPLQHIEQKYIQPSRQALILLNELLTRWNTRNELNSWTIAVAGLVAAVDAIVDTTTGTAVVGFPTQYGLIVNLKSNLERQERICADQLIENKFVSDETRTAISSLRLKIEAAKQIVADKLNQSGLTEFNLLPPIVSLTTAIASIDAINPATQLVPNIPPPAGHTYEWIETTLETPLQTAISQVKSYLGRNLLTPSGSGFPESLVVQERITELEKEIQRAREKIERYKEITRNKKEVKNLTLEELAQEFLDTGLDPRDKDYGRLWEPGRNKELVERFKADLSVDNALLLSNPAEYTRRNTLRVRILLKNYTNHKYDDGTGSASTNRERMIEHLLEYMIKDRDALLRATTYHPVWGNQVQEMLRWAIETPAKRPGMPGYNPNIDYARLTLAGGRDHLKNWLEDQFPTYHQEAKDFASWMFIAFNLLDITLQQRQLMCDQTRYHNKTNHVNISGESVDPIILQNPLAAWLYEGWRSQNQENWFGWWSIYFPELPAGSYFGPAAEPPAVGVDVTEPNKIRDLVLSSESMCYPMEEIAGAVPIPGFCRSVTFDPYNLLVLNPREELYVPGRGVVFSDGTTNPGGTLDQTETKLIDIASYKDAEEGWYTLIKLTQEAVSSDRFGGLQEEHIITQTDEKSKGGLLNKWIREAGKAKAFNPDYLRPLIPPMLTHFCYRLIAAYSGEPEQKRKLIDKMVEKLEGSISDSGTLKIYRTEVRTVIHRLDYKNQQYSSLLKRGPSYFYKQRETYVDKLIRHNKIPTPIRLRAANIDPERKKAWRWKWGLEHEDLPPEPILRSGAMVTTDKKH